MAELSQAPAAAILNLRGAPGDEAFMAAAAAELGVRPPIAPNRFDGAGELTLAWLGPDEWLIVAGPEDAGDLAARLEAALSTTTHALTDVSGAYAVFRISGPTARDALAAGCSLDLHPRAFAPGQCAQTLLARAGVLILQRDAAPTYDLLVRRSFSTYLADWFRAATGAA